ncbi:hypothetical protein HYU21_00820 [Candidatus Woesearchaeota archaeon]|nr:hypothetical protein [Candidatus Woesearchaeota archaeon]
MVEKNYLSRGEQRLWEYIKDKEIIDSEIVQQIFPEFKANKINKLLYHLAKKKYLNRARKDLYYNQEQLKSYHKLASRIRNGYIGLSSALRYYNLITYEDFTIFVITDKFRKRMDLKGTNYSIEFIPLPDSFTGFEKKDEIYVSSIEKTLFDCLLKPRLIGMTNISQAFYNAKIDWPKFISFFKLTPNSSLYQRTGYLLDLMKKKTKLKVPKFVFEFLLKNIKYPVKLIPNKAPSKFNKKWLVEDNLGEDKILSWWM